MIKRGWQSQSKKGRERTFLLIFNAVFLYVFFVLFLASIYLFFEKMAIFSTGLNSDIENSVLGFFSFLGIIKQVYNIYKA
ncbi:MAG TPA: hypothetical protein PLX15_04050 [Candidatus Woesearchaeota archaeon]|nr:hypothetical protein [Candidatus Woesearchaeota archaeon]